MDRKRKAVPADLSTHAMDTRKRPKTSSKGYSEEFILDNATIKKNDAQAHLQMLNKLTHEMTNSPENMQYYTDLAGPDVMQAIAELNKKLLQSKVALSSPSDVACDAVNDDISRASGAKGKQARPALPVILDKALEKAVFTHPGVSKDHKATYDRLEILGDAYIELIATRLVWNSFRDLSSGRISQIRELLVKNETLSEYAEYYGFDCRASVPPDYLTQNKRWTKTKGDIFEAYVAAVILSDPINGYRIAERWLSNLWMPKLRGLGNKETDLHAKEALAKKIMGKGIKLRYIDERPPLQLEGGMQTFFIGVYLTGWGWDDKHLGSGQGLNKTIAGNQAASHALQNQALIDEITAVKTAYERGLGLNAGALGMHDR